MPQIWFKEKRKKFDDVLATDDLFVEYFNQYLGLPCFPERLCFNKETGGFEIVTEAKKVLGRQIKAAIRSGQKSSPIYKTVKSHSFVNIPLIPIEDEPIQPPQEIDTTFTVQAINKNQGINWIKKERLPSFLESDTYLEYRLAKLLSQAQIKSKNGEVITMHVVKTPKKEKKKSEERARKEASDTDKLIKGCFVSTGNMTPSQTEAWLAQAKVATRTSIVSSTRVRPSSAISLSSRPKSGRPASALSVIESLKRTDSGYDSPTKSLGLMSAMSYGSYGSLFSEMDELDESSKPVPSSKPFTPRPSEVVCVVEETETGESDGKVSRQTYFSPASDPVSEESGSENGEEEDEVILVDDLEKEKADKEVERITGPADSEPTQQPVLSDIPEVPVEDPAETVKEDDNIAEKEDNESAEAEEQVASEVPVEEEEEEKVEPVEEVQEEKNDEEEKTDAPDEEDDGEEKSTEEGEGEEQEKKEVKPPTPKPEVIPWWRQKPAEEIMEDLKGDPEPVNDIKQPHLINNLDDIAGIVTAVVLKYAYAECTGFDVKTVGKLKAVRSLYPDPSYSKFDKDDVERIVLDPIDLTDAVGLSMPMCLPNRKKTVKKVTKIKEPEPESDEDSLLDSDEDFEEGDEIFRKTKYKTYKLANYKGIQQFSKFLDGTTGDKYWKFWIDLDRLKVIENEEDRKNFIIKMRERYHKAGGSSELPPDVKRHLGLTESRFWTTEKLTLVQNKVAEMLILYWAPRFLLKQERRANPLANNLYRNQVQSKPRLASDDAPHPEPIQPSLLPLRPKSCVPKLRGPIIVPTTSEIQPEEPILDKKGDKTRPLVGYRRVYSQSALKFAEEWKNGQPTPPKEHKIEVKDEERELLTPTLPVEIASTPSIRPSTAKYSTRPSTAAAIGVRPSTAASRLSSRAGDWDLETNKSVKFSVRPQSAPDPKRSTSSQVSSNDSSVFLGGRRMEVLLQGIAAEGASGAFFKKYVEQSGNKYWIDALKFWCDLQDYHVMFYNEIFDSYALMSKARYIYSLYIVDSSSSSLNFSRNVREKIRSTLLPPYEELFDEAEELCLGMLYDAWQQLMAVDSAAFEKIELQEIKRTLETKNKYVLTLQKRGLIRQRSLTPDDPMEGYEDPVYDPSLFEKIPEEFRDFSLDQLVHNRIELEHYKNFLQENYASTDLMCWMDIEVFRRIPHTEDEKRDQKAKDIRLKYLNKKYFFGSNSPAGKQSQEKVVTSGGGWGKMLEDRPPTNIILDAQKYVKARLEKKWLPLFVSTDEFAERQKPTVNMDDVVDDVLMQRKKKSAALSKLLESKWVSSSKDIINFRKALTNPVTSLQFRRYVSIKSESLENDVLFWLEVQKYKELYHVHTEQEQVNNKVSTIISCFIDSQIPPSLQIDIPFEMADKILDKRKELGPYIFRESQLTVFRVLFSHWADFLSYRSNLAEDRILPTLERQRRRSKLKNKALQRKREEEATMTEALKKAAKEKKERAENFDPFAQDEPSSSDSRGRDHVSWTYSQYLDALDMENTLNNTDASTFSSLSDMGSMKTIGGTTIKEGSSVKGKENGSFKGKESRRSSRENLVEIPRDLSKRRQSSARSRAIPPLDLQGV